MGDERADVLYNYAAEPRALKSKAGTRNKRSALYRPEGEGDGAVPGAARMPINIHADERIARGSTWARSAHRGHPFEVNASAVGRKSLPGSGTRRRAPAATLSAVEIVRSQHVWGGRQLNNDIDLRCHLEENIPDGPEKMVEACQTDPIADRPASAKYVPRKTGQDAASQVEAGTLFDLDGELEPLLQVLVGKTLEQAQMEVLQERQLELLEATAAGLVSEEEAAKAKYHDLEAHALRMRNAADLSRKQRQAAARARRELERKIACIALVQQTWVDVVGGAVGELYTEGAWKPPLEVSVQTDFWPWLGDKVKRELEARRAVSQTIEDVCRSFEVEQLSQDAPTSCPPPLEANHE